MNLPALAKPVRGWCPGALRPMDAADGWIVRVRPWGGRLSPAQAVGLAETAARWADSELTLTQRGNLQLRGVSEAALSAVQEALDALGLLDPNPQAEARRNLLVQPFWQTGDLTHRLADALSNALQKADDLALPAKFGFAVDTGERPLLRAASADVRLERLGDGVLVYADGARAGRVVAPEAAVSAALALARCFARYGGVREGRGRMRQWVARSELPASWQKTPLPAAPLSEPPVGPTAAGSLVGVAWGRLPAETLAALATVPGVQGIRVTPWRALVIEGATAPIRAAGLIVDPADPRWRIALCTGAPGCAHAAGPTRPVAEALLATLPANGPWHITGCPKGCAHPQPAWTIRITADGLAWLGWASADAPAKHAGLTLLELSRFIQELPT